MHPQARVAAGGREGSYVAREATGTERERYWRRAADFYRGFPAYARRAGRDIPVSVLEPRAPGPRPGMRANSAPWWPCRSESPMAYREGSGMWGSVVSILAPIAWGLVRERLLVQGAAHPGSATSQQTDLESRVQRLEKQLATLSEAQARQIEEVARILKVIGLRATVALWLSISSAAAVLVLLATTVFRS